MSDWRSIVADKRTQREALIPKEYKLPSSQLPLLNHDSVLDFGSTSGLLTSRQVEITSSDVDLLLSNLASGVYTSVEVLEAFIKRTCLAHQLLNPLTEIHFLDARRWAAELDAELARTGKPRGPLHGLPMSVKDQFRIKGSDATIAYISYVGNRNDQDSVLVTLLKKAGAVPFVKTNLPQTIMYAETQNELWGRTTNPHNRLLHVGGSSGGEGALVAFRGSPLGVGTDVGGSVRLPSAFCGIWGLRPSSNRLPYEGAVNSMEGQESVLSVIGPMANSLNGLVAFTKAVLAQEPWLYDPLVPQVEWRQAMFEDAKSRKSLKIGIMYHDGLVRPFPGYTRALKTLSTSLASQGHTVVPFEPYKTGKGMEILGAVFTADGGRDISTAIAPLSEPLGPNVSGVGKPEISAYQQWELNKRKNKYRKGFLDHWNASGVDCLLAPTAVYSALPHGSDLWISYTGLFNLVDYPAVVVPVTKLDKALDPKPPKPEAFLSQEDEKWWKLYDPETLHGAPIGIQVVARRYQEEAVLGYAQQVWDAVPK